MAELAEWYFSGTRHQRCEWHLSYGLGHALGKDGLSVEERKPLAGKLSGILARGGAKARKQYRTFTDGLEAYSRAHTLLTNAEPYILYSPPSSERTTSVMEREMREVNRRTDVGARWSIQGISNLSNSGWRNDTTLMTTSGSGAPSRGPLSPWCPHADVN